MHKTKVLAQPSTNCRVTENMKNNTPTQNMTINSYHSWKLTSMQTIKTIAYVIAEILKMCYFGTLWTYLRMPGYAHSHA